MAYYKSLLIASDTAKDLYTLRFLLVAESAHQKLVCASMSEGDEDACLGGAVEGNAHSSSGSPSEGRHARRARAAHAGPPSPVEVITGLRGERASSLAGPIGLPLGRRREAEPRPGPDRGRRRGKRTLDAIDAKKANRKY